MFSFFSSDNSKKGIAIIILIAVVFGLFLVNVREVKAGWFDWVGPMPAINFVKETGAKIVRDLIGDQVENMLQGIAFLAWQGASGLLTLFSNIFTQVLDYTSEIMSEDAVYKGWKTTRDIVNMFFILGLIVIAFATILRIESYGMKSLLPKLIIIAILINFSFLACGVIVDASHIIANTFTEAITNKDTSGENTQKLGVGGKIQAAIINAPDPEKKIEPGNIESDIDIVLAILMQAGTMFVAATILLIGAILLIIRLGAIWILIILAPFAWFFGIFPSLKHMNSKWWNNFLKYAFFAPIYIFFVYLGLHISNEISLEVIDISADFSFKEMVKLYTHFLISVMIFGGAPIVAMSMGIHGSQAVINSAKRIGKGAVNIPTKGALRVAGRWAAKKGLPTPRTIKQAWTQRRERKEQEAYGPAVGKWRDRLNKVFGGETTFYEQRSHDVALDKERSELRKQDMSKDALVDYVKAAKKDDDINKFKAGMLELISQGGDKALFEDEELGAAYDNLASPENMQKFIKNSISGKQEAVGFAARLGETAKASGLLQYSDLAKYDPQKKAIDWNLKAKLGEKGGEKIMQASPSERWKKINPGIFFTERNGEPVKITNSFKTILKNLEQEDVKKVTEDMSTLNKKHLVKGQDHILEEIREIRDEDPEQANLAQKWFNKIKQSLGEGEQEGETVAGGSEQEEGIVAGGSEQEFRESRGEHGSKAFG